ncbi:MAG: hypothetical protein ABSF68_10025 [Candidatus Acidiferrales bacterium]
MADSNTNIPACPDFQSLSCGAQRIRTALLGPFQMSPKETTGADELSVIASGGAARDKP